MPTSQDSTSTPKAGVYCITCTANGRYYIGSAVNLIARERLHRINLKAGNHHSRYLQNAWNKYGPDAFEWSVLEYVDDPSRLIAREQVYIDTLDSVQSGFNIAPKAGSCLGVKHTAETRVRLSEIAKAEGRTPSSEAIAKSVAVNKSRKRAPEELARLRTQNKGRKRSPKTIARMMAAQQNRSEEWRANAKAAQQNRSEEWRANIAAAKRGKKRAPDTIAKVASANRGMKRSAKTRAKMSATHKERWRRQRQARQAQTKYVQRTFFD